MYTIRLAISEGGLAKGALFAWGIRRPRSAQYEPQSVIRTKADGTQSAHGHSRVRLAWDLISEVELATLARIKAAATGGLVYVTIRVAGGNLIDVSGYMPVIVTPPLPLGGRRYSRSYPNFELVINNCTVINDPSSYQ